MPRTLAGLQADAVRDRPDVCLVLMPYAMLEHPSLALGLLKARLAGAGFRVRVVYANLAFAEAVGFEAYRLVESLARMLSVGDWTFGGAAFPGRASGAAAHLRQVGEIVARTYGPAPYADRHARSVARALAGIRRRATAFTDRLAREVAAWRPRLVACSSNFEQHAASLALLRRVRELAPGTRTLIGGANCEGLMGAATVRAFPWVDAAFSGEADEAMVPLCRLLTRRGRLPGPAALPAGALTRASLARPGRRPGRAVLASLARVPMPDFEDYFRALSASPLRGRLAPAIVVEGSRGCWWGERRACTFCGRSETGMRYRSKPAGRLLAELAALSARHGLRRFALADNILDPRLFRSLLPRLKALGRPYDLVAETKSGLTRAQVKALVEGGVRWVQPGIESLHDGPLRLMGKGVSALANLRLLKHAREFGLGLTWNLLYGLPGERDAWRAEMAAWLPLLAHLPPPASAVPVHYVRGSDFFRNPRAYGLRLAPYPAFRHAFPVSRALRQDLSFFFHDAAETDPARAARFAGPGLPLLLAGIRAWQAAWKAAVPPLLCVRERGRGLDLYDTRPCAPARRVRLAGLAADLYRLCLDGAPESVLLPARVARAARVRRMLERLADQRLVLRAGRVWLALAVPGEIPDPPGPADYPGGYAPARFRELVAGWVRPPSRSVAGGPRMNHA